MDGITRLYFEADDLTPWVAWVKSTPRGMFTVLIGDDSGTFKAADLIAALKGDRGLDAWLLFMFNSGMIEVSVRKKVDLPVGVPLTS